MAFELFDGGETTIAEFGDGKPIVLNFWASWCPACVAELPDFQAVSEERIDDVTFLGLANMDDRAAGVELLEASGVTYTIGDDPGGDFFREFELLAMPSTIFISAEGEIIDTFAGQLNDTALNDLIDELVAA